MTKTKRPPKTNQRAIDLLIEASQDALEALYNWAPPDRRASIRESGCFNSGVIQEDECQCTAHKLSRAIAAVKGDAL